jgi:hypothetical protein
MTKSSGARSYSTDDAEPAGKAILAPNTALLKELRMRPAGMAVMPVTP